VLPEEIQAIFSSAKRMVRPSAGPEKNISEKRSGGQQRY